MKCSKVREKFIDYVDDDVRFSERIGIEVHIARCYACREELDELMNLQELCRSAVKFPGLGPGVSALHERIAVREAALQSVGVWGAESSRNAIKKLAIAAIILFVLGVGAPLVFQFRSTMNDTSHARQTKSDVREVLTVSIPFILRKNELEYEAQLAESVFLADTHRSDVPNRNSQY
jgi:anti-sigma factor RsiW